MGTYLEPIAFDWKKLEQTPPDERKRLLAQASETHYEQIEAEHGDDHTDVYEGWHWSGAPETDWCAAYYFRGLTFSLKKQRSAADLWAGTRVRVDPSLRDRVDRFVFRPFWFPSRFESEYGSNREEDYLDLGFGRPWHGPAIACSPNTVAGLAALWAGIEPHLGELYDAMSPGVPAGPSDHHWFLYLVDQYADIVTTCRERDWGYAVLLA